MDDEVGPVAAAGPDDGTGAVLYGMFTSFTEALGDLDGRLAAIEEAVRHGPPELELRLAALEDAVRGAGSVPSGAEDRLGAVEAAILGAQAGVETHLAAVEAAVLAGSPEMESRLAALEAAARTVPPELTGRLAVLEASLDELSGVLREVADAAATAPVTAGWADAGAGQAGAAAGDDRSRQSDLLERRAAELAAAVESVRALIQSHIDDTAHSLGRRAGEAGRRLASDLGLRGRSKPPG